MTLKINSMAPDFSAETSEGKLSFHDWLGDSWGVLFSHPKDFTPVCTTELGALAKMKPEFEKRNVKVMGLSVDPVSDHVKWLEDIKDVCGLKPNYPIVADEKLEVAKLYNMLEGDAGTTSMGRTAVDNETVRTVYVIRPDKRIGLFLTYPMTTGRNFNEILRTIDSMQRTAKHKIATPADWVPGATDQFAFVPIAEELGFIGGAAVFSSYLLLVGVGLRLAIAARREFDSILAIGTTIFLGSQAWAAIAVAVRLLPPTGSSLPFVAFNGSVLVTCNLALVLLLRISETVPFVSDRTQVLPQVTPQARGGK